MTMTHAVPTAAQAATKLQAMIDAGRGRASRGLEALDREWRIRHDLIARPDKIGVDFTSPDPTTKARDMVITVDAAPYTLTHHSRAQLLAAAEIPSRFADTLQEHDLHHLVGHNLAQLLPRTSPDGLLIREVDRVAKGVLSTAYRRMDSAPLFQAFVEQALQVGLLPHLGEITDTRAIVSFLRPEMTQILPGEHVVWAVELKTSDYGNGALDMALSLWRLLCTNGAIGQSLFRKVHLGRRFDLGEEGVVRLSDATVNLDTRTIASGLRDVMKALPAQINASTEAIREVAGTEVNLPAALTRLTKAGLRKATVEKVRALYETEQPVESLPEMPGKWRLSNVLGLIANSTKDGDEAHDLRELAGSMLAA